jgi:uncharacterized membrane protein
MNKSRLEAFSDGVLAIIITIMILEIKAPEDDSFESLKPLIPVFLSYVLNFISSRIRNHIHQILVDPQKLLAFGNVKSIMFE